MFTSPRMTPWCNTHQGGESPRCVAHSGVSPRFYRGTPSPAGLLFVAGSVFSSSNHRFQRSPSPLASKNAKKRPSKALFFPNLWGSQIFNGCPENPPRPLFPSRLFSSVLSLNRSFLTPLTFRCPWPIPLPGRPRFGSGKQNPPSPHLLPFEVVPACCPPGPSLVSRARMPHVHPVTYTTPYVR